METPFFIEQGKEKQLRRKLYHNESHTAMSWVLANFVGDK